MGNGRETCALPGKPPNQVPRGRWRNEGLKMLLSGRVGGTGFRPIAKARAMACGSNTRVLPDLRATPLPPTPQAVCNDIEIRR